MRAPSTSPFRPTLPRRLLVVLCACVGWWLPPAVARGDTRVAVSAQGGLPALDVNVDLASATVEANGASIPIGLDRASLPPASEVTVESIAVGLGRRVVHVRVPDRGAGVDGRAWEAILAPGQSQPVFAAVTGLAAGDPGERTGKAVQIVEGEGAGYVLVGDLREDLTICGQPTTLLDPLALYPASMDLRPATVQRLSAEQRAGAQPIVATGAGPAPVRPLASLLVARGSSVPGSRGAELTDDDVTSVWSERRPGMGQGEFVVMAAPKYVPISRMQIVFAPPKPADAQGVAPKSFYLVTNTTTYRVTVPTDGWRAPGGAFAIAFPAPIETSCVALVLDDAYTRALPHPDVSVAELYAYSEFDTPGATLGDVAAQLSGPRGTAAAQVLERAGAPALQAVERAYDQLDAGGRALAVDVAASHDPCAEAAPLLSRALCEGRGQAPRRSREKLDRCPDAAPVLAAKLRDDAPSRACVARELAALAHERALEPIADAIDATPDADSATRTALRASFAEALESASPTRWAAIAGDERRSARARLEMMRAAEGRVSEVPVESKRTLDELLAGAPPMRTRYLVLGPLGDLARAGDRSAVARLAAAATHDADWPVRARAAELLTDIGPAHAALVTAARDREPRVREAALQSLVGLSDAGAIDAAAAALSDDHWPFVRAQAVGVLVKAPASDRADKALGGALADRSSRVRGAALVALARRHAFRWRKAIRERLDDKSEEPEVRASAAHALGAVCDVASADRLTELARELGVPGATEDQQQVALGALVGLAALQPADLRARLAPLLGASAPAYVRAAAEQALSARGACH